MNNYVPTFVQFNLPGIGEAGKEHPAYIYIDVDHIVFFRSFGNWTTINLGAYGELNVANHHEEVAAALSGARTHETSEEAGD